MRSYLYPAVSVSGASILAIEILGTRIVGPSYGVDIFLWSALITITLAALAVGYWLGGHWADRGPAVRRFAAIFVAAGVWVAAIPLMRDGVVAAARPLDRAAAMFVSSVVLFFPPLAILGMASPYALKLRAGFLEEVGRSAGDLYAISTVASVAGALLTGFVLVPSFGVRSITAAIGVLLVATGVAGLSGAAGRGASPPSQSRGSDPAPAGRTE